MVRCFLFYPILTLANLSSLDVRPHLESGVTAEPFNTFVKAFSSYGDVDFQQFRPLLSYFQRMSLPEGFVLWEQGDDSDGLYIIESGVLRATYRFADHTQSIEESMVPGTLAGELSALSTLPRNATTVVERSAVVWKLSIENLRRLETEEPALGRVFTQLVLKGAQFSFTEKTMLTDLTFSSAAKIDYDILLAALASRQ